MAVHKHCSCTTSVASLISATISDSGDKRQQSLTTSYPLQIQAIMKKLVLWGDIRPNIEEENTTGK